MAFPFSLLLLLLFMLPFSANSQTNRNVSLGSTLAAGASNNDHWVSPSGDFAFGFQLINNSRGEGYGYLLCIVFDRMPERTVVWSANRNDLVPAGSTIQLTDDGQVGSGRLVLADPSGRVVWTRNPAPGSPATGAAMLDTGNFVVTGRDSSNLWASFDELTDTLLPTQVLGRGEQLIAKYSRWNFSEGRFKFALQPDGNLVQYTTTYPQMGNNFPYWASSTTTATRLIFNQTGIVYLASSNGTVVSYVFRNGESSRDFYQRVTLDHDGVLRYYASPKGNVNSRDSSGRGWTLGWTTLFSQPANFCFVVMGKTGSGACGYNSYCEMDGNQNPICKCPQGYVFMDPLDEYKGCIQDFAPQDCRFNESDKFDLVVMPNADYVDGEYTALMSYTEDMCRQACLSDCRCDAAVYGRGFCWKKKMPLSNGRVGGGVEVKALIKVRVSNSTMPLGQCPAPKRKKDHRALIISVLVLFCSSALVNLLVLAAFVSRKTRRNNEGSVRIGLDREVDNFTTNLQKFSYSQLESATGGFKEVLGSGASGTVYKGVLGRNQQVVVAVKMLDKMVSKTQDQEFSTEVKVIGGTNHKNLVKLVGFCYEGQHRLLVYEYMSNGSLADLLFDGDRSRPSWYTRAEIAYAVSKGLVYLHEECSTHIIHCDIKPQNILLDDSMTAKISDFGLAKLLKANQTRTMTGIRGTRGYVAPEWFKSMPITAKVDVHSFGILLLELVCCRKNLDMEAANEEEIILADWAVDCYSDGKLGKLVKNDEEAMADIGKVERFVEIAIWCLQDDPIRRPEMKKVAQMLEGSIPVPTPPDPESYLGTI